MSQLKLLLLLGLISALPLVRFDFLDLPFEYGKFFIFLFFGAILLVFNITSLIKNKTVKSLQKPIFLTLFGFVITNLISTVFSLHPLYSLIGLPGNFTGGFLYLIILINIFFICANLKDDRKLILQAVFFTGFFVAIYGLWQFYQRTVQFGSFYRLSSTIGHPDRFAFYLLGIIPLGFYFFLAAEKKLSKLFAGMSILIIFSAFFLTYSRTALTSLLVGVLLFIFLNRKNIKFSKSLVPIIIILFLGFMYFGMVFVKTIPSTAANFYQSSLGLRMGEIMGVAGSAVNRSWWRHLIGNGPETTFFTYFKHRPALFNLSIEEKLSGPAQVRNYYLQLFNTVGLFGLVFFLFFGWQCLKNLHQNRNDSLSQSLFYCLFLIFFHSLFYYQTENILLLFWIYAGITLGGNKERLNNFFDKGYGILSFILGLMILSFGINFFRAEYSASTFLNENGVLSAVKYNPYYDTYFRKTADYYLKRALMDLKAKDSQIFFQKAIEYADLAYQKNKLDVRNLRLRAKIYYQAGVFYDKKYQRQNIFFTKELVDAIPTDSSAVDLLGLVYLNLGELNMARREFEKERLMVSDSPTPYLHLGEVAKQQGRLKEALILHQKAVDLLPGWDFSLKELEKTKELLRQK